MEALGSWSIGVSSDKPLRIIWDATDELLIIERLVKDTTLGQSFREDAWIARKPEEQIPERTIEKLQELPSH